jgi:hypothetical protein
MSDYSESVPALKDIYLEDSYVLAIHERPEELRFDLDAVLTETHPRWTKPQADEQYAYLRMSLVFARPRRVEWVRKSVREFRDATGEIDYGNIDSLRWDGTAYELAGDWGHVRVESDAPTVVEAG